MSESSERWRKRWEDHRPVFGYVLFVIVVFVIIEVYQERERSQLVETQRIACQVSKRVTENQRLVLQNLISLRVAALTSPYLKLEAARELPALQAALNNIRPDRIEEACL